MSAPSPRSSPQIHETQLYDRPVLAVSLSAVASNWHTLRDAAPHAEVACVLKADGYGLGAVAIARKLVSQGCRTIFVATLAEACDLREAVGAGPRIFVLNGLPIGAAAVFASHDLIPVLNSLEEIREWTGACRLPAAIHLDTGMSRAGLSPDELSALTADRALLGSLDLALVMSHLACADEHDHPQNALQLSRFKAALAALPSAPASFANSGGVFLGPHYHFDLVRPGIALYGGNPTTNSFNPMQAVAALTANVLNLRTIGRGDTAGYSATFAATRQTRLAVCNIGYADGILRSLSNRGVAFIDGIACPYAGRVSMDLLTIDVTAVSSAALARGAQVEIIGPHMTLEDIAARAGSVNYEILTGLGSRFTRVILDGQTGRIG